MRKLSLVIIVIVHCFNAFAAPLTSNTIVKAADNNHTADSIITESTNFIGINSSNPSARLDVVGTIASRAYGNFGINTTSPRQQLEVAGHTQIDGSIYVDNAVYSAAINLTGFTSAPVNIDGSIYADSAIGHFMGKINGVWKQLDN